MTREADIIYEPTFAPADHVSREIVLAFAKELGLSSTPKKTEKVVVILSSLLWAAQRIRSGSSIANLIGWSHDDHHWVEYPAVGKRPVNEVREALITGGWLTLHTAAVFKRKMTVYHVSAGVFAKKGTWIQSTKPPVSIKTEKVPIYSISASIGGQKLTRTSAKKKFGRRLEEAETRVSSLAEYWQKHPLTIEGNQYCSATRVFNDGSLNRGGRLFGGWVGLPETTRLTGTIDGDPVAEIDLRGANLTLLTGITGNKMPKLPCGDPYAVIDAEREMVKQAVLELLGSGNPKKNRGSPKFIAQFGRGEFVPVRDKLLVAYPGLKELEKGVLDSNALAFRESEIVLATIEELKTRGIASYPMHDALICKAVDAYKAADVLQEAFQRSCGVRPSLTIQGLGREVIILGCYNSR